MMSQRQQSYREWLWELREAAKDCDPNDFDYLLGVGYRMQWIDLDALLFWSSVR